ncbi:MAG: response regulator [Burkholderiaceae bacterium]|nr:response regulator [Burkholderiaceae bacterium]
MNTVHLNLYIVDDDEAVRTGLGSQFIARGYSVRAFKSGELFLTAISAASEGVVILDLRMDPGMGGIAVFNTLRSMGCPLLVLFLSGHGTIPQAVQAVKDGAFGWLPKPCDENDLLEQVQRAMQTATADSIRRRAQRAARKRWDTLTPREVDTALLDALGKTAKEVAKILTERDPNRPINYRTVENHRSSVYSKLGLENSNELQKFLRDNGLTDT